MHYLMGIFLTYLVIYYETILIYRLIYFQSVTTIKLGILRVFPKSMQCFSEKRKIIMKTKKEENRFESSYLILIFRIIAAAINL